MSSRRIAARVATAVFGVLLALQGCGGGASAEAGGAGAAAVRWVVLGSSTAAGAGAGVDRGWVSLLATSATPRGVGVDNRSHAGVVTYQALPAGATRPPGRPATIASMDIDQIVAAAPRLLILAFPSNDTMLGYTLDETVANLLTLRQRALHAGVTVMLLSTQPRNDAGSAQRATMKGIDQALAPSLGACFVDVREALADSSGGIATAYGAGDGMHLNDAGHRLIHELVTAVLAAGKCLPPGAG